MHKKKVDSSLLSAIAYNPQKKELELAFNSGSHYLYHQIPEGVYEELLNAESKGRYFNDHIKDLYNFTRLK